VSGIRKTGDGRRGEGLVRQSPRSRRRDIIGFSGSSRVPASVPCALDKSGDAAGKARQVQVVLLNIRSNGKAKVILAVDASREVRKVWIVALGLSPA
jgi:hypothetical protein